MGPSGFVNDFNLDDGSWIVGFIHIDAPHIHSLVVEELNPLFPAVARARRPGPIIVTIFGINIGYTDHLLRSPAVLPVLTAGLGSTCPLKFHVGLPLSLRPRGAVAPGDAHRIYFVPTTYGIRVQSDSHPLAGYCDDVILDAKHPCAAGCCTSPCTFPDHVPASHGVDQFHLYYGPWIEGFIDVHSLYINGLRKPQFNPLQASVLRRGGPSTPIVPIVGVKIRLAQHLLR